jgi:hypothetical protein
MDVRDKVEFMEVIQCVRGVQIKQMCVEDGWVGGDGMMVFMLRYI